MRNPDEEYSPYSTRQDNFEWERAQKPSLPDDLTHVHCAVCGCTYLQPMLACPKCGVLRAESQEVAAIRRDLGRVGFHVSQTTKR